jgi:hypothetical protein
VTTCSELVNSHHGNSQKVGRSDLLTLRTLSEESPRKNGMQAVVVLIYMIERKI